LQACQLCESLCPRSCPGPCPATLPLEVLPVPVFPDHCALAVAQAALDYQALPCIDASFNASSLVATLCHSKVFPVSFAEFRRVVTLRVAQLSSTASPVHPIL
jgi:hypothetical protein